MLEFIEKSSVKSAFLCYLFKTITALNSFSVFCKFSVFFFKNFRIFFSVLVL